MISMAILCGQKTVTTAGSAESLAPSNQINAPLMVKALHGNGGLVYVGNANADVDSSNGLPLAAGEVIVFQNVGNIKDVWLDAAVDGEGVALLVIDL
jgi:hypothetical protein